MRRTDIADIAIELVEAHPDVDPQYVNFVDLRSWVLALDGFDDEPDRCGEKILEPVVAHGDVVAKLGGGHATIAGVLRSCGRCASRRRPRRSSSRTSWRRRSAAPLSACGRKWGTLFERYEEIARSSSRVLAVSDEPLPSASTSLM